MSEIIKYCKNCKYYDEQFCNYKEMFKSSLGVCDNWEETKDNPVSHPSHYTNGNIEVIDYIEDKNFNFNLGNVVKYVSRAGKKDVNKTIEDLQKGAWYLDREIKRLKGEVNE